MIGMMLVMPYLHDFNAKSIMDTRLSRSNNGMNPLNEISEFPCTTTLKKKSNYSLYFGKPVKVTNY